MFKKLFSMASLAMAICLLTGAISYGQETSGAITGTVKDVNGAGVPNATVTVTDATKKNLVIRTVQTSDDGVFSIPNILVSTYNLTVEAPNFKKSVTNGIKVDVGSRREVEVSLTAGNINEVVTVAADQLAVEVATPTVASVITGDQVRELQLNNRNFVQLVTLSPGVSADLDDIVNTGTNNPETQTVNRNIFGVNGARSTQNTFTVDGADITDRGSNLTIQSYPSVDSIGEFKVLRGLYSAESGRSGGGQINIVTRAGTDKFHGSFFEFLRNEKLNANNNNTITFTPSTITTLSNLIGRDCPEGRVYSAARSECRLNRRPFRYNNFGFTIGGPIYFLRFGEPEPDAGWFKRYSKTFFFFSEEQRRDIRYPTLGPSFVPDALLKQGVFPIPVCLSATGAVCNQTLAAGAPISGAGVHLSTVAQQYVNNIWNKVPNSTAAGGYLISYPDKNIANFQQEILKIDHHFTNRLTAFYRYGRDKIPTEDADGTIGGRSALPFVNRTVSDSPGRTHSGQLTYAMRPNLIFEGNVSYGYGAIYIDTTGLISKANGNINAALPYENVRDVVPVLSVNGFASLTGFSNYIDPSSKLNISGTSTYIHGNHTMKLGAIWSRYYKKENALSGTNQGSFGTFNNSTNGTSVLAAGVANTTLNQNLQRWANFLTGNFVTFTQNRYDLTGIFIQKNAEGFFQDEWRARSNVSVSMGVRYSYFGSPTEKNGFLTNFAPELWDRSAAPQVTGNSTRVANSGNYCNGIIVNSQNYKTLPGCNPKVSPYGEHIVHVDKLNFAPRVGLTWDPFGEGTTVIRTGYGMYHGQVPLSPFELLLINNPYQEGCTVSNVPMDNPVAPGVCPAGVQGYATTISLVRGIDTDFKTEYMQQWSLDVQRTFAGKMIAKVGYVGSKGTHLYGYSELNAIPPGVALNSQCAQGTGTLQNPGSAGTVRCLSPGQAWFTNGLSASVGADQIRPYRGYRSIDFLQTRFNSNYHALQAEISRRFSGMSQVHAAYTWSKNLTDNQSSTGRAAAQNTYDIGAEYGRASLDRRHMFTLDFFYELPWMRSQSNLVGKVLGGWQISGIAQYQTGLPQTITTSGFDPAGLGVISAALAGTRPNVLCDPVATDPTRTKWFNTECFQQNPLPTATGIPNVIGNSGRGILDGPPLKKFDLTVSKNVRWGERYRLQLRAEAFNVLNMTVYRGLSTNVTSTTFGQVITFRDPRTIQLGAKFYF